MSGTTCAPRSLRTTRVLSSASSPVTSPASDPTGQRVSCQSPWRGSPTWTVACVQVSQGVGCNGQYAADQDGPLQGPHGLLMERSQRGVVARVERSGLFP